jgi:hypothetical protein
MYCALTCGLLIETKQWQTLKITCIINVIPTTRPNVDDQKHGLCFERNRNWLSSEWVSTTSTFLHIGELLGEI